MSVSHRFSTDHDRSPVASRTSWEESVPVRTGHGSFTPAASPPSPHHRQAPPTPRRYPDPVMDYLVSLCQGPGLCDGFPLQQMQDPMLLEVACASVAAAVLHRQLPFSPVAHPCNERHNPTLERLDRVFCNKEWDLGLQSIYLQALSSSASDHCPLFLSQILQFSRRAGFKFQHFWIRIPAFQETVATAWAKPVAGLSALNILHHKPAQSLRSWSNSLQ